MRRRPRTIGHRVEHCHHLGSTIRVCIYLQNSFSSFFSSPSFFFFLFSFFFFLLLLPPSLCILLVRLLSYLTFPLLNHQSSLSRLEWKRIWQGLRTVPSPRFLWPPQSLWNLPIWYRSSPRPFLWTFWHFQSLPFSNALFFLFICCLRGTRDPIPLFV